ncbi:MAG: Lrp/AsnC family transcriptional regulator [Methanimicrococcus sp.]|nr:Lrp/AsnC family transcriptional regulator [Methanimicrococcus sp.]
MTEMKNKPAEFKQAEVKPAEFKPAEFKPTEFKQAEVKSVELDNIDRQLINLIQLRFPVSKHPFEEIAAAIGTTEEVVISKLTRLKNEGIIRRIGPIINTRGIGGTNTLAAVKVPKSQIDEASWVINKYAEVSHNYLRNEDYNIWFTVSAPTQERLDRILSEIQTELSCPMLNLPTINQFKIQVNFHV